LIFFLTLRVFSAWYKCINAFTFTASEKERQGEVEEKISQQNGETMTARMTTGSRENRSGESEVEVNVG
jgi:hypothetical protein